ncbi:MAG: DUF4160 domain-containing protein [Kiritimatiellia bacterium]|jgi:hypothetical protein
MSPTVFREDGYRFHFFSLEESRGHVHVVFCSGTAKSWFEPKVELAMSKGFSVKELNCMETIIKERKDEIKDAWRVHFGG